MAKFETSWDQRSARLTDNIITNTEKSALDIAIQKANVDLKIWSIEKFKISKSEWDVTMKLSKRSTDGKILADQPHSVTNYKFGIEIWFIRKLPILNIDAFNESIIQVLEKKLKLPNVKVKLNLAKENNQLFPGIVDAHFGKLAWEKESEKNYDVKIAMSDHISALETLIKYAEPYNFGKSLVSPGHDTFNYDFSIPFPQTTHGTPQEADVRWQKMFILGVEWWVYVIERLKAYGPVEVQIVPGNHDYQTSFYLGAVLEMKYINDPLVHIDNLPKTRKYSVWGKNLIGIAHGKWERPANIHMLMSEDFEGKKAWSNARYKYFYMGDKHHIEELIHLSKIDSLEFEKKLRALSSTSERNTRNIKKIAEDFRGVLIQYLPTLAQVDKYEFMNGFVGTVKASRGFIHNKNEGEILRISFNN